MNVDLIRKLRKQREISVQVGKFTFLADRPTDVDALILSRQSSNPDTISDYEICKRFVHGWEGVTEDDIAGGGSTVAAEFSPELWAMWLADRTDFWQPIATALLEAFHAHRKRMEDVTKN